MSEKLEQFISPIEAENVEDRAKQLEEELSNVQILYAKKIFESNNSKEGFLGVLDKIGSNIGGKLRDIFYIQNRDLDGRTYRIEEDKFLKKCSSKIDEIYLLNKNDDSNLIVSIAGYLKKMEDDTLKEFPEYGKINHEPKNKIGLLKYVSTEDDGLNAEMRDGMNKEGFKNTDQFIMLHLDSAFKNENGIKDARKWLGELAEIIIDQYPQIKAVIGSSWLFDHRSVQRLVGFKNMYDDGGINWNQFVDEDGQIKKNSIEKLFEDGKPPYKNLVAYDGIISFLRKFLPKDKKGWIDLKDVNPEWEKCYSKEKFNEDAKIFKREFKDLKEKTKEGVENIFNNLPRFKDVWQKLNFYDKLIEIFTNIGEQDLSIIFNNNKDFFEQTEEGVKEYFSKIVLPEKFITNKVLIN